jgi:predicted ABC-type ATPase
MASLILLAGPNGAGKSTFYEAHLQNSGLPFLNADIVAKELTARLLLQTRPELHF